MDTTDEPAGVVVWVGTDTEPRVPLEEVSVLSVDGPAALFDALAERRVRCVVLAPDGADWDPVATLSDLRERETEAAVVLTTGESVDRYVDAGVLSAVADVVRPDDESLSRRVGEALAAASERAADHGAGERYRALVEGSPAPVGVVDADGTVRFANRALADLLAVEDPDDLVGRSAHDFLAPDEREASTEWFQRVIDDREPAPAAQRTLVDDDGERKYAVVAVQPVVFDGAAGAQVVADDVTEHKRLQAALREERDRFSTLFENLNEPVVETHFEGDDPVVTDVNDAFVETFGVDPTDATGRPLDDIIVPVDDRERAADINRRARAGDSLEVEVSRRTPDGPRDFLLRFAPHESDGVSGGYAIYVDITERREWEHQLRCQNERLEELAAVVSHDLRNPLNVAQGTVETLARDADAADREHFERVQRAHERMVAIVDDMLTLARQGQSVSELEPVSLATMAEDAWETTETAGATLAVETDVRVRADGSRLRQALENLFRNSVQHGGDGVTVRVGALPDCPGEADPTTDRDGPAVRRGGFYVADDGPGIPEDEREAIFESGFSTADDGTGLGLAIVKSIVEAHGWSLTVRESESGGARFEITGVAYADAGDAAAGDAPDASGRGATDYPERVDDDASP